MQAGQCCEQHESLANLEQEVLGSAHLMRLDVAQCELAARLRLHVKGPNVLCGPRVAGALQQSTVHPSCLEQDKAAGLVHSAAGLNSKSAKSVQAIYAAQQLREGPQAGQTCSSEPRIAVGACSASRQCALR